MGSWFAKKGEGRAPFTPFKNFANWISEKFEGDGSVDAEITWDDTYGMWKMDRGEAEPLYFVKNDKKPYDQNQKPNPDTGEFYTEKQMRNILFGESYSNSTLTQ